MTESHEIGDKDHLLPETRSDNSPAVYDLD